MILSAGDKTNTAPEKYQPFYCEENIWHAAERASALNVLWISNRQRRVLMMHQKAGSPVLWDYHVVLETTDGHIFDFDTTLVDTETCRYLSSSFPVTGQHRFAPMFRVVPASEFRRVFFSDRSHMSHVGEGAVSVPPWNAIGADRGNCIVDFCNIDREEPGRWMSYEELYADRERRGLS